MYNLFNLVIGLLFITSIIVFIWLRFCAIYITSIFIALIIIIIFNSFGIIFFPYPFLMSKVVLLYLFVVIRHFPNISISLDMYFSQIRDFLVSVAVFFF